MCKRWYLLSALTVFAIWSVKAQKAPEKEWHNKKRVMHYLPDGQNFKLATGTRRFNRALYGTNTGFRVEAGDLPEFAMYMPGMGGNLKFGLISGSKSKWLINAGSIEARYRPGSMLYTIRDSLLGKGVLYLTVLALAEDEGMIVKADFENAPAGIQLSWAFGGATGLMFRRDGDIGVDPESSFYLNPGYCRDNHFDIVHNSFTLYYGSGKALSQEERYEIQYLPAKKAADSKAASSKLTGTFPEGSVIKLASAEKQSSPLSLFGSVPDSLPLITGKTPLRSARDLYFLIVNAENKSKPVPYQDLAGLYKQSEKTRAALAARVQVNTPDPYINTLGGALSIAADAIWEYPSYVHGAIAWRQPLNGWRGAYIADPLGWHDRARKHFSSYALSQITTPETGPVVADTALNLARQLEKVGTSMFSSGYISRKPGGEISAHHYDMNLVFIDQLLTHYYWTGDLAYVKEMWPLLKHHLAWEKRNFDGDKDGLYDAYCCIWSSDALQYSGGGVTHSSAYNYRANKMAARLATLLGEDPQPYQSEADKIFSAVNSELWMSASGHYAEYKDQLGLKLVHPSAGLWTTYTAIDEGMADLFQAYQATRYVDTRIPHIPVKAAGLPDKGYYLLSSSNWQPYTWSLNNVVLAEELHTSLAFWQAGRMDDAFKLWKSALVESMYMSASPGGFEQLSFYDAIRGELYRDFADPIGIAGRTLVEGLFGVHPDVLAGVLTIRPGLPSEWDHASMMIPDLSFQYRQAADTGSYTLTPRFPTAMKLRFQLAARAEQVKSITVNGKMVSWKAVDTAVGKPVLEINAAFSPEYRIRVVWNGKPLEKPFIKQAYTDDDTIRVHFKSAQITNVYDPQNALLKPALASGALTAFLNKEHSSKTVFVKVAQGQFSWWEPLCFEVRKHVEITSSPDDPRKLIIHLKNNSFPVKGRLVVNEGENAFTKMISLSAYAAADILVPAAFAVTGSSRVRFEENNREPVASVIDNWECITPAGVRWEKVDLTELFNDKVTNIFKNKYLSPRSPFPTLQLPVQGIGNWVHLNIEANIDDSGFRRLAGGNNEITLLQGIPFATPGNPADKNILFTSQWDNYPDSATVPLSGSASHVYLLMAGSTNPMQSRITNGKVRVTYMDNTSDSLELKNPENWWPIEEDYLTDGYAFTTDASKPYRVYLKTGKATRDFNDFITIRGPQDAKGISPYGIDGGAATVLDLPLNPSKVLKQLTVQTLTNDVVIGLMSVTLMR